MNLASRCDEAFGRIDEAQRVTTFQNLLLETGILHRRRKELGNERDDDLHTDPRAAMNSEQEAYRELCRYAITHHDASFIHQHVVDAFTAQSASQRTEPIALTFALVGLYLHVEKGFSGSQVQRAHMRLELQKRPWPRFGLPGCRGAVTVVDVVAAPAGSERDHAIDDWCGSVWEAFREERQAIVDLLRMYGIGYGDVVGIRL